MTTTVTNPATELHIIGYCHASASDILNLIACKRERELLTLGGNFVLTARRGAEQWIVTAPYGVVPYFYCAGSRVFVHGPTVNHVLRQTSLEWKWNVAAVADLLALEHLTHCQTLHADVARTPPGSLLYWDGHDLTIRQARWTELHPTAPADPDRMIDVMIEEVARCAGDAPVVSASAGFDSRVLLAALLASGKTPRLVVQGRPNSTDRVVVESIGRQFRLPVDAVELTVGDYPRAADIICEATSGTKPANHWHTYLYPAKTSFRDHDAFFVGANGEFARSYYLDKGMISLAADSLPTSAVVRQFWRRKLKRTFLAEDLPGLAPELAQYLHDGGSDQICRLSAMRGHGGALEQLDRFYLEERVRHFIGNGLTLYGLSASWRTPFLSTAWVAAAQQLPRRWKLGSNWHRYAIRRLCPRLLDFPEDGVSARMADRHGPLYWSRWRRRRRSVPFMDYTKVFADRSVLAMLHEHAGELAGLVDAPTVRAIVDAHRRSGGRRRAVSILLAMSVWRRLARSRATSAAPAVH